jgi:hypothetical protein
LLDPPGRRGGWRIAAEGPDGKNSLVLQKQQMDAQPWESQVFLPRLKVVDGARYRVSLRLKAEHPAPVWLTFGQRTSPYHGCGLDQKFDVAATWIEATAPFRVAGANCGADNNRLSIMVGRVAGKFWISGLSLTPETSGDGASKQHKGER